MNKYIMITTTFDNEEEAKKVITTLLEKRLVSCCQISNIQSLYQWKGTIANEKEFLVQMKTRKELYPEIEKEILNIHSYEVPQIIAYDIVLGHKDYLNWIDQETKKSTSI